MTTTHAPVPRDARDVAIAAARAAGAELAATSGRTPGHDAGGPRRAAAAAAAAVLGARRPQDAILLAGEAHPGSSGLRWLIEPLDGAPNHQAGIPLFCASVACEDAVGTLAGAVHDPVRDEVFAGVRGGALRIDGAPAPHPAHAENGRPALVCTVAFGTAARAKRAGKLHRRLGARLDACRALGSPALELAWTAAGRFDACFHEADLSAAAVDAGLFLCQRAGLRVHRLPPLEDGLAPRILAAREPLAAELLELIGPGPNERRRAAQRAPLSAGSVADAMRRRRR